MCFAIRFFLNFCIPPLSSGVWTFLRLTGLQSLCQVVQKIQVPSLCNRETAWSGFPGPCAWIQIFKTGCAYIPGRRLNYNTLLFGKHAIMYWFRNINSVSVGDSNMIIRFQAISIVFLAVTSTQVFSQSAGSSISLQRQREKPAWSKPPSVIIRHPDRDSMGLQE